MRQCTGDQVKTYLVPPLRIWIVNIVEGVFINLSKPCLLANCYETVGIPFAVPSVKLKSKPVNYTFNHTSPIIASVRNRKEPAILSSYCSFKWHVKISFNITKYFHNIYSILAHSTWIRQNKISLRFFAATRLKFTTRMYDVISHSMTTSTSLSLKISITFRTWPGHKSINISKEWIGNRLYTCKTT